MLEENEEEITRHRCLGVFVVVALAGMAALLFAILRWIFFVPIHGSVIALFVAAFLYIFTLLSLGLLISTRAQTQMEAFQLALVFLLPGIFFSGFIFPRETMPWIFYWIGACMPATAWTLGRCAEDYGRG